MQNVNLIDRALIPPQPRLPTAWVATALALVALAVGVHALFERHWTTLTLAHEAPAAKAPPDSDAAPDAELARRVAQRAALLAVLQREAKAPQDPAGTLLAIAAALPESMWLTEIELSGARGLRIAGGTLDVQALSEFARRLEHPLSGIGLATLRLEKQAAVSAEQTEPPSTPAAHHFTLATPAESEGAAPSAPGAPTGAPPQ